MLLFRLHNGLTCRLIISLDMFSSTILSLSNLRRVPAARNLNNPKRNERSESRVGYAAEARGCVPEAHYYSIADTADRKSGFYTAEVSVYTRFVEIQVATPCGIVNIIPRCTPKVSELSHIMRRRRTVTVVNKTCRKGGKTRNVVVGIRLIARGPHLGGSVPTFAC